MVKPLLAILAAALLLASCGGKPDPFVGTWRRRVHLDPSS